MRPGDLTRLFLFLFVLPLLTVALSMAANDGVILLHGLCRSSGSMKKMANALSAAGFAVANYGYASRTADIRSLADLAIGQTLSSPKLQSCPRIHFVTHSLGGILVRSYFTRHPQDRLGRVVMLGPPNQGSEVVDALKAWRLFRWLNGPAGAELGTDVESTPNRLGPVDFQLGVIAGDRSINWISSLMIPGKDDGKVSVERTKVAGMTEHLTLHSTHPYLMKNREVIDRTVRFLKEGSFFGKTVIPSEILSRTG